MKIFIANQSKQKIGGAWSFIDYFSKYYKLSDYETSDIYFIAGATMVEREAVIKAKADNKRIVLRVDNMPKNSRNRNTGFNRLFDYANLADLVIYQSQWAKDYIKYFIKKDGLVIYNGINTDIFKKDGNKWPRGKGKVYMYSRYNRDDSKRLDEAFYYFHQYWRKNKDIELWLMGRFAEDLIAYNFDFVDNENIKWLGILEKQEEIAMFMRSTDVLLCPFFNDACSNTVIEALCCGCQIDTCLSGNTGGTKEILELHKQGFDWSAKRMINEYINEFKKL
jgi:glycosyltransferase involved in cell wall biosynthesis